MPSTYSEEVKFSEFGVRMAIIDAKGKILHQNNCTPEMLGGFLPAVGDHITTLWDPLKPEPADHYRVAARYYVGELMGDNCWWLLLEETKPTDLDRKLFALHRKESAKSRSDRGEVSALVELRRIHRPRKGTTRKPGPNPKAGSQP